MHMHHGHSHDESSNSTSNNTQDMPIEKRLALMNYMVEHTSSHAEEMHDLAHGISNQKAASLIHEAMGLLSQGADKLSEAIQVLKEEGDK